VKLDRLLDHQRTICAIGFDDAPFVRHSGDPVAIAGVVCGNTRFEGMIWGEVRPDGWEATETLSKLLLNSKFLPQLHVVLLDGISLGGFNVIDLPLLCDRVERPCIAVMRRMPDLQAISRAMHRLPHPERRFDRLRRAGTIHHYPPFYFQVCGATPELTARVLHHLTDRGHVPEPLRLAHLIGAAVMRGESSNQA
jgi:hypothetical protein